MNYPIVFLTIIDKTLERVFDIIGGAFNFIWSILCSIIYGLIVIIFNIFNNLTQLDILTSDQVNGIYQRITMIITIVMVFYITFEFVKYVVSPDTISDKEKGAGKIVMRIVIAILLIAFLPTIFTTAMKLQNRILNTNVISKVIFGVEDYDYKSAGSNFAGDVFKAFYRVNYDNCSGSSCAAAEEKVNSVVESWKKDHGLWALTKAFAYDIIDIDNTIQFDGLLAVAFGAFTVYVLLLYCMDVAVRYIQLIFLQIIAPVAAISYIVPQKESMLQKWTKQVTTTYLDVFIRIAVLYFMLLIVSILAGSLDFYEMSSSGKQINIFVYLFVIMGLLIFVQRAPKLIQELFPSKGGAASIGFGFDGKSRFEPLGKSIGSIMKPTAAAGSYLGATYKNLKKLKNGELKGIIPTGKRDGQTFKDKLYRGATYATSIARSGHNALKTGYKTGRFNASDLAAQSAIQEDEKLVNEGGSVLGRTFQGNKYQQMKADMKLQIENLEAIPKSKDAISSSVKSLDLMQRFESYQADWLNRGIGDAAIRAEAGKKLEKACRVFSVSSQDAQAKQELESTIENSVRSIYGNPSGPLTAEQQTVITNLINNAKYDSAKWDTIATNTKESKKISGNELVNKKDANGNVMYDANGNPIKMLAKDLSDTEFAARVGDISDAASAEIASIKASDEYKAANVNASEAKK